MTLTEPTQPASHTARTQPAEPWAALGTQAHALAQNLRALAQEQPPESSAVCLSYAQIVEELAHVAESGGAAPAVRRLGSLMTPRQMQQFGQLLRDRRNQAGLSRTQLGRKAQLSDSTVKFLETARHPPSRATVLRLIAVPELKLSWADVPGALMPPREPASDAPEHALLAALHRLDPRLTTEAVCELSVLADELRHHQELIESTHYGCRRWCRLCGARSEGTALDAQQAPKLPLRHGPLCVGQLAHALLQKHPALAEVATTERRSRRTATAQALAEGTRLASLQRFYGCRAGAELAAQLTHNAALPPSPYSHGVAAVLLWALGLGPCPVEPTAPFSEAHAQRLAALLRSGAQPATARERALGIGQATTWLLDEHAPAPSKPGPGLAPETSPPPQPFPAERRSAPHG